MLLLDFAARSGKEINHALDFPIGDEMRNVLLMISLAVLLAGCASPGTPPGLTGSANYQRCAAQCGPGNAGNGTYCLDGCRVMEAVDTNNTAWCDVLDNKAERPSCYGHVAKSSSTITVCDRLSGTEKDYCVSTFGAK